MIKLWQQYVRTWKQHLTMQVATLVVLSGTFTVISFSLLVHQNLKEILSTWGDSVQLSIYLRDNISEDQKNQIMSTLQSDSSIENINLISKDQAAKRFLDQMSNYAPELLLDKEFGNPLPASIQANLVRFGAGKEQFNSLVSLAGKLEAFGGVEEVSYGQGWVENYSYLVSSFSTTSGILIFILLAGSLFVVGNSIRNSISQRRDEIEVLELIGGTKAYIKAPFIFEGILMGLSSALIALVLCYLMYTYQIKGFVSGLGFWGLGSSVQFLSISRIFALFLLGGGFGALGSLLCVRRLCSGWAAAERNS